VEEVTWTEKVIPRSDGGCQARLIKGKREETEGRRKAQAPEIASWTLGQEWSEARGFRVDRDCLRKW